jgi:putative nucleotidyltransferase with HDIG domain
VNTFLLHGIVQKKPLRKTAFNAAVFALTILVSGGVYQRLGGPVGMPPQLPVHIGALLAMGLAYFAVNTLSVSAVIALSERRRIWAIWQVNFRWTIFHMLVALPVGLAIAVVDQSLGIWGVFLFVTPLILARYSFKLYTDMKKDLFDFVRVLTGVIDEVHPYTRQHSLRVARYSVRIARAMDVPQSEVETIEIGALLHDLGKIKSQHRELLLKPAGLSAPEMRRMCEHAAFGAAMASQIRSLRNASEIVRAHHERLDGRGYPRELPGATIPLGARIVSVADAFDAMTSQRDYNHVRSVEAALAELRDKAGTQFDPAVVDCLARLVRAGEIVVETPLPVVSTVVPDAEPLAAGRLSELPGPPVAERLPELPGEPAAAVEHPSEAVPVTIPQTV